ncbi:sodium/potassium/calcium exchanger 4-like [Culicoides brevitarsis]|uniref:sodium/potassium/calcium exchanger 4-like n=1 Tax=Culicoides brevitarsis TaxID=469753 RepID=UPI00307B5A97
MIFNVNCLKKNPEKNPQEMVKLKNRSFLGKKFRIAIWIRIFLVIIVPSVVYTILSVLDVNTDHDNVIASGHRKLLSVNVSEIVSPHAADDDEIANFTEISEVNHQRIDCNPPAIDEFPPDGFTRKQRKKGWLTVHILLTLYCFWFLAIICDDYFVPAIESLCSKLQMNEDVAGATFMAMATSSPELFINCVGTFITKGDLGVGTVIGAAVFNILAVPACCGLFAHEVVKLDWYSITRDSGMYAIAVLGLIGVLHDGIVMWYEALALILTYFIYITVLYYNDVMSRNAKLLVAKYRKRYVPRLYQDVTEISPLLSKQNGMSNNNNNNDVSVNGFYEHKKDEELEAHCSSPWGRHQDEYLLLYIIKWPLVFLLWITVPDVRKHPKLRYLTFLCCIIYIGLTSYVVSFLITVFGDTLNIPDTVMGLTFLAAGTSVPEAVSSVIVTNQGHGAMGISNSIGSNTFDVLLCLGIPWLVKSLAFPAVADQLWVVINSTGLTYSTISLMSTLIGLYVALACNGFHLDKKTGVTCAVMYVMFLIFASLVEMNVFFPVNVPTCGR